MSDTFLRLISVNPAYVPSIDKQQKASGLLKSIYPPNDVKAEITKDIEFIDQGQNFDSINCNICGKQINIEAWQNAMDEASKKQFADISFITPCCRKKTSLNNLLYHSNAGFAKFVLTISNPDKEISTSNLFQLEEILGTQLRIIWAHY